LPVFVYSKVVPPPVREFERRVPSNLRLLVKLYDIKSSSSLFSFC